MQESNKRFDMILADFRNVHDALGLSLVQNIAQAYQEDGFTWDRYCRAALGDEDAEYVIETLTQSVHELPETFGVSVTATSAMLNKEAEKAQFIGMLQTLSQIYGELMQLSQVFMQVPSGTPLYETAAAAYTAGTELTARILEKFDVQNPEAYLGNLKQIAQQISAQGQQMGSGAQPAAYGAGGGAGPLQAPGGIAPPLLGQDQIGALLGL
jgi:hypothetical protein